jgi:hypothetical protein
MRLEPFDQAKAQPRGEPVPIRVSEVGTVHRQGREWRHGEVLKVHPADARRLIAAGSAEAI